MVRISQAVAKNMIDAKIKGSIVNISSTLSEVMINNSSLHIYCVLFVNVITYTYLINIRFLNDFRKL